MPYGAALSIRSEENLEAMPFSIFCWVSKLFQGPIWPCHNVGGGGGGLVSVATTTENVKAILYD